MSTGLWIFPLVSVGIFSWGLGFVMAGSEPRPSRPARAREGSTLKKVIVGFLCAAGVIFLLFVVVPLIDAKVNH